MPVIAHDWALSRARTHSFVGYDELADLLKDVRKFVKEHDTGSEVVFTLDFRCDSESLWCAYVSYE